MESFFPLTEESTSTDADAGADSLESGSRSAVEGFPTQHTDHPLAEMEAPVPDSYLTAASHQGTLTKFSYQSIDRAGNDSPIIKEATVYLPYGYEENGSARYDILYLMHGWTGNNEIFFSYDDSKTLQNVLDHMIENGDIAPTIVVTPTFDRNNQSVSLEESVSEIKVFHEELWNDLMPALEKEYHTYAETADERVLPLHGSIAHLRAFLWARQSHGMYSWPVFSVGIASAMMTILANASNMVIYK